MITRLLNEPFQPVTAYYQIPSHRSKELDVTTSPTSNIQSTHSHAANDPAVSIYSAADMVLQMLDPQNSIRCELNTLQRALSKSSGRLSVGHGVASGDDRAKIAFEKAATALYPALDNVQSAGCALLYIRAAENFLMDEYSSIAQALTALVNDDTSLIISMIADETMTEEVKVSLLVG